MRHQSWLSGDHVDIQGVNSVVQTTDGYLWLGTASGILRFDGVRFVKVPLSSGSTESDTVRALLRTSKDEVWVATVSGLYRLAADLSVTQIQPDPKASARTIVKLFEDRQGRVFALFAGAPAGGIRQVVDRKLTPVAWASGLPGPVISLLEDSRRRFWIGTRSHLCRLTEPSQLECTPMRGGAFAMVERRPDELLVTGASGVLTVGTATGSPVHAESLVLDALPSLCFRDSSGSTWIGTLGQGLIRIRPNGSRDSMTKRHGLSSNLIEAIFEDRSGSLWVATSSGLDRFSNPPVAKVTAVEGLSGDLTTAVYAARDGSVWAGTAGNGLNRIRGREIDWSSVSNGLPSSTVTSLVEDGSSRLWAATTEGLAFFNRTRFTAVPEPQSSLHSLSSLESDSEGLWAVDRAHRILRILHPGSPDQNVKVLFPEISDAYRLCKAPDGALWVGHYNGSASRIAGNEIAHELKGDSAGDPVRSIFFDSQGRLWVCSSRRLSMKSGRNWTSWTKSNGLPEETLHGAVESDRRIWVFSSSAVFEFLPSEGKAGKTIRHEIFLGAMARSTSPRLAATGGDIWIASDDGLGLFQTATAFRPATRPNIIIESLMADGVPQPLHSGHQPEFLARDVQMEFTATAAAGFANSLQFRYRLAGLSPNWSRPSSSRRATFVNLKPGVYTFCVAAGDQDVDASTPVCTDFRVLPRVYQSWWFLAICTALAVLAGWSLYRLRMNQVRDRFELILQERLRVARDLHDTVLQGFSGVTFQLEAAAKLFDSAPDRSKHALSRAIEQADRSLLEARQTISYLRLTALEGGFVGAVRKVAKQLTEDREIEFHVHEEGDVDNMAREVEAVLYLAVREAIQNAVRHASPRSIRVSLKRNPAGLNVCIKDDGVGFNPESGQVSSKWGLRGAQERSNSIGAKLSIISAPGAGTEVHIWVPRNRLSRNSIRTG